MQVGRGGVQHRQCLFQDQVGESVTALDSLCFLRAFPNLPGLAIVV